ncbi:hypothetical protein FF38_06792 [Lucilia cuprina]|uniref:Uncharacterized protein n=1 Tax=Lucilia cuprina TaxID=7375 RepID=A0A0L0CNS5_LUCCU|nr:hypothetical protein FF38_06792 [Lucilia cuprina]
MSCTCASANGLISSATLHKRKKELYPNNRKFIGLTLLRIRDTGVPSCYISKQKTIGVFKPQRHIKKCSEII